MPIDLKGPKYMRWLPSSTTATISRLEFIAMGIMNGFISGKHKSPRKGFSIEFAEHREYVPGDDLLFLIVAGDIRENVKPALADLLDRIKSEAVTKQELSE